MKSLIEKNKVKRAALKKLDILVKGAISVFNETGDESVLHEIKPPNDKYFTEDEYNEIRLNLSKVNTSLEGLLSYCTYNGITEIDKIIKLHKEKNS